MNLDGYESYKESEKQWIGFIPAHWKESRVKFFLSFIGSGKTPLGGANVYIDEGIKLLRSQNIYDSGMRLNDVVFITDDADALQASTRVQEKDVLLNITGASIGRTSIATKDILPANVNQHVCILRPITKSLLPEYLHKLLCSRLAKEQILENENGTSREGLNFTQIANLFFPLPDISEQKIIIAFLDHKTQQIDQLIAKKQTLIDKLQEQRIALITHAVTKGLNPDVKMKDSGVEWLGQVPEHWSVVKFKYQIGFQEGPGIMAVDFHDTGIPLARIKNVQGKYVSLDGCNYLDPDKVEKQWKHFKCSLGDLVISGSASTGLVSEISESSVGAILYTGLIRLWAIGEIAKDFIGWFVSSNVFFAQIDQLKTGSTIQHFGPEHLRQMLIAFPPQNEQKEIVDHLAEETARIDRMLELNQQTIDKLKEYRTALITAAVTGKIDVRHWQENKEAT